MSLMWSRAVLHANTQKHLRQMVRMQNVGRHHRCPALSDPADRLCAD